MYTNHLIFDLLKVLPFPQARLWEGMEDIHTTAAPAVRGLTVFDREFRENLFRKVSDYAIEEIDSATLDDFLSWEKRTASVNRKIAERLSLGGRLSSMWSHIREFLDYAFATFSIEQVSPRVTHGASHNARRNTHPLYIFGSKRYIDHRLATALRAAGIYDPLTRDLEEILPVSEEYPVLDLVEKTWKTKRVIIKQIRHKQMWQSGIGDWLTSHLKRVTGYDPVHAKDKHMALARYGSLHRSWYTIDLTHASDTVGEVWAGAFPGELAHWLRLTREGKCVLPDGSVHTLHMLAGAGNGWTFAVETAIFYAIIYATLRERGFECKKAFSYLRNQASVFGDDIIIKDKNIAEAVFESLIGMGFSPNQEKSYLSGSRRESCGGDYSNGISLRSFYAKGRPETIQEWISFCNGIRRVCYRDGDWVGGRSGYYDQLWRLCVRRVSELIAESDFAGKFHGNIPCGPSTLGDTVVGVTDEWGVAIPGYPGELPIRIPGYGDIHINLAVTPARKKGSIMVLAETTKVVAAETFEQVRRRARAPWHLAIQAYLAEPSLSRSERVCVKPHSGDLDRHTIPVEVSTQLAVKAVSALPTSFVEGDIDSLFASLSQKQRNWLSRSSVRMRYADEIRVIYEHGLGGSNTPMCSASGFSRPSRKELGTESKARWVVSEATRVWD